jgi:signal transduction histidine kinase
VRPPRLRIANTFALAFLACGVLVIAVYTYFASQRQARRLEASIGADLTAMASVLEPVLTAVWEDEGETRALEVVQRAANANKGVAVRWTNTPPGTSSRPEADARAVTSPLGKPAMAVRFQVGPAQHGVVVELTREVPDRDAIAREELTSEILAACGVAFLAAIVAKLLGDWVIGRPLERIVVQARRIGGGNLSEHLVVRGAHEVASLKKELNSMCDQLRDARTTAELETRARLTAIEQLRHTDRLRTVGTLASGVAHELGTPLNVVMLRAGLLRKAGGSVADAAEVITGQVEKMTRIVRQLLDFARRKTPRRIAHDVRDIATKTSSLLSALARKSSVELEVEVGSTPIIAEVDGDQLEQALANLVVNAIHASPEGATVRIRAGSAKDGEAHGVCLEVIDQGTGIEESARERIFEPFFTTKDVGAGTGLGLAVALGIVQDHGGTLSVASAVGKGSTFSIELPVSRPS